MTFLQFREDFSEIPTFMHWTYTYNTIFIIDWIDELQDRK